MRLVAGIILSFVIVGLGLFFLNLPIILINRSSNTGFLALGAFLLLVGLGNLWRIIRGRRRDKPSR